MVLTLHPFEASKYLSHSSGYLHKYPSNWKRCRITTHGTCRTICQCTATTQGSKATTQGSKATTEGSKATTQGSKATTQGSYAFEFFSTVAVGQSARDLGVGGRAAGTRPARSAETCFKM